MRGKLAIVIGIMMVVSGMAIIPLLGNADVNVNDGAPTTGDRLRWTIPFANGNMWDDPTVLASDEPIVINEDNGGEMINLGDEVTLTFQLDNNETGTEFLTTTATDVWVNVTSTNTSNIEVNAATSGAYWAGNPGWPQTITVNINVTDVGMVEHIYNNLSCRVEYTDGVTTPAPYRATLPLSVYISAAGHNPATPDEAFSANLIRANGGPEFLPYDTFEEATMTFQNHLGASLQPDVQATTVVPGAEFTIRDGGIALTPTAVVDNANLVLNYRLDVAAQTAPGTYMGTFDLTYMRTDTSVDKTIVEMMVDYELEVDFAPYVMATFTAATMIQRDTNTITFDVTFTNSGNVDIVGLEIEVDQEIDDLNETGFQYEQGEDDGTGDSGDADGDGGRNTLVDTYMPGDMLVDDATAPRSFTVSVIDGIGAGRHYVPFTVRGYFFNDGSIGDATQYQMFEITWDYDVTEGIGPRDPMVDMDSFTTHTAGYYTFGTYIYFDVDLVPTWAATVDNGVALYVGGNTQTTGVYLPVDLDFTDPESTFGVDQVSVTLQGGADTPFTADATAMLPLDAQDVWMNGDSYDLWFMVDIDATLMEEEMYGDAFGGADWHVPITITCHDIFTDTTTSYTDWINIYIDEAFAALQETPTALQIEEKTLDVGQSLTVWLQNDARLEDAEFTLQVGNNTPYILAGDPSATSVTICAPYGIVEGGMPPGPANYVEADFSELLDLNPDVTPGAYWVDLTVSGYTEYNRQYVEINNCRMQDPIRVLPEPADIFISSMTMLDAVNPGGAFTVEINITNIGGMMVHDLVVDIDPAWAADPWFQEVEFFLEAIQVAYVDTTNDGDNAFDTSDWDGDFELNNVTFCCPGEWYLPLNESLPLFGIEDAYDIYELSDWVRGAFSTPVPQVYTMHIDTLAPGDTYSLNMEFYADKDMIPGRVYTNIPLMDDFEITVTGQDELNVAVNFNTEIAMKTDSEGAPYQASVAGGEAAGDLNTGMMALIVVLMIIIIVLMLLGWSEIRRPYEEDDYDMMEDDYGMDEPIDEPVNEPMPEPFEEPVAPEEKNDF